MKPTRKLSLPFVVLVAVAVLALGTVGVANATSLTVHSVRKIAAKVVKKKAPGLSVAHAATAGTANNANAAKKADLATKATSADDATTLAGQPAQLYLDRIGFVSANHVGVGADTGNTLATVTITVPQGASIIHAIGDASMPAAAGDTTSVWTRLDSTDCSSLSGPDWTRRSIGKGTGTLTTQFATPTTAGPHTVVLCGSVTTSGIFADVASLSVQTVPRGSTGGGSL